MLDILIKEESLITSNETGVFDNFYLRELTLFQGKIQLLLNQVGKENLLNSELIIYEILSDLKYQLMDYCSKVLIREYQQWKKQQPEGTINFYEGYNQLLLEKKVYESLLNKYPVMERLIKQTSRQVFNQVKEVLFNFRQDKNEMESYFHFEIGQLQKINFLNSDAHNDGRRVMILTFENNNKLVYKPHSLAAEESFNRFLKVLNDSGELSYPLRNTKVMDKDNYGWQEFIKEKECRNVEEIQSCFYRIGAYSALFTLLQTSDLHYENIIVQGEYPMFVDLETLVSVPPKQLSNKEDTVVNLFYEEVNSSILASLLFPQRLVGNIFDLDLSGLTGGQEHSKTIENLQIVDAGTDFIRLAKELFEPEKSQNRVVFNGEIIEPTQYFEEILKGIDDCFTILLKKKVEFIKKVEMNEILYGKFRQVLRPTHVYAKYLEGIYHPEYLEDEVKAENLLKIITEPAHYKERTKIEFEELLHNDIPYFVCENDKTTLDNGKNEPIYDYFEQTPKNLVINKFRGLTIEFIQKQKYYLRLSMSLYSHNSQQKVKMNILEEYDQKKGLNDSLVQLFKSTALWDKQSEKCTWLLLDVENDQLVFSPLTPSFYLNGGIIWYLATAGDVLKDYECTRLARSALNGLKDFQKTEGNEQILSAYASKYSAIYLYYNLSVLWKERDLLEQVYRWIEELTRLEENSYEQIDYVNGLAGLVHLLTVIYEQEQQTFILETAIYLAEKLFSRIAGVKKNSGLAHGYSGYALALASVYRFTKNSAYKRKIRELIHLEDQLFDPLHKNWIDQRTNQSEMNYWCYGALGIVFARQQLSVYLKDPSYINTSFYFKGLKTASLSLMNQVNAGLCHGLSGNLAALEPLVEQTKEQNLKVLYKKANEDFQKLGKLNEFCTFEDPATLHFMLGLTGVGYELFRKKSSQFPSVLNVSIIKKERGGIN